MSTLKTTETNKIPKTARGVRTRNKLLEAAEWEFGSKGFYETSIGEITRRAEVALGTFYVYFESKDEIFRALVGHMSRMTRQWVAEHSAEAKDRIEAEELGLSSFIDFVRQHQNLYRIIMEAQFVAPDAYREHYENFAEGYRRNLTEAAKRGEISEGDVDVRAWSLIGMSVFLGLRFGVWDEDAQASEIAERAVDLIGQGLKPR